MIKDVLAKETTLNAKPEIHRRFYNYLLLNGSFSDQPGLISGKGPCIIYFYCLSRYWANVTVDNHAYSFLDETLSGAKNSILFDNGLAGTGILLAYLIHQRYLDEDTSELLKEIDQPVIDFIYSGSIVEINISKGLSGLGLYCLHRLHSTSSDDHIQLIKLKGAVGECVSQLAYIVMNKGFSGIIDISLLNGYTGTLFFLNWINKLKWHESQVTKLTNYICRMLLMHLNNGIFSWQNLEIFFVLLHCEIATGISEIRIATITAFNHYMARAAEESMKPLTFSTLAFNALWLELIGKIEPFSEALLLADKFRKGTVNFLENYNLGELFPFSKEKKTMEIGLQGGLCASALPLLSMETKDYSWLSIFGIEIAPTKSKDI